ncbi:MAG: sigma-70 family RNA polymerase sigma factor [Phycisphaerae bacterium]|nr:sigma-70 family RNA polymerase sigma factor [Phycisphaerae bacterium]
MPSISQEQALFTAYAVEPTTRTRNAIVIAYLPLVRQIASRVFNRLIEVEQADLEASATIGLIDAIGRFDLSKGIRFHTFAHRRINGAIFDNLRRASGKPRPMMDRAKRWNQAVAKLRHQLGREPTLEEIRIQCGNPSDKAWASLRRSVPAIDELRLDEVVCTEDSRQLTRGDCIADPKSHHIGTTIEVREIINLVINRFSITDALILRWYYLEGFELKLIAQWFGVTDNRLHQRLRELFPKLRRLAA